MFLTIILMGFMYLQTTLGGVMKNENNTIVCTEHEIYTDCINPCVPTCQIPYPRNCEFLICHEGCICKEGYIKNHFMGNCVPIETCKDLCLVHQEYKECGSACPPTCQRPNPVCPDYCVRGCYCNEGFIFDAYYEQCVESC